MSCPPRIREGFTNAADYLKLIQRGDRGDRSKLRRVSATWTDSTGAQVALKVEVAWVAPDVTTTAAAILAGADKEIIFRDESGITYDFAYFGIDGDGDAGPVDEQGRAYGLFIRIRASAAASCDGNVIVDWEDA